MRLPSTSQSARSTGLAATENRPHSEYGQWAPRDLLADQLGEGGVGADQRGAKASSTMRAMGKPRPNAKPTPSIPSFVRILTTS